MARSALFVSLTAIMGALAIALSLARIQVPYPLLPFLKVDFAEIPSFIAYFLLGPLSGACCAALHWLGMVLRSGNPVNPTFKLLAVLSNLLGFWAGEKVGKGAWASIALGAVSRVAVMTVVNLLVFAVLAPGYLELTKALLRGLGLSFSTDAEALAWALLLIGVFNAIHAAVSGVPALLVARAVKRRIPQLRP